MEARIIEDGNGYRYIPVFMKALSCNRYTQTKVYHIFTDNPRWAANILPLIVGDNTITKGEYSQRYKAFPTIENALISHHKVEFIDHPHDRYDFSSIGIDSSGYYEYTIIFPYDD